MCAGEITVACNYEKCLLMCTGPIQIPGPNIVGSNCTSCLFVANLTTSTKILVLVLVLLHVISEIEIEKKSKTKK